MTEIPKERRDVLRERVEREIRECESSRGLVTSTLKLKDGELRALLDMADERDRLRQKITAMANVCDFGDDDEVMVRCHWVRDKLRDLSGSKS